MSTGVFGPGRGPVFLDEVVCSGTEQELMECAHAGIGNHMCGRAAVSELIQSEHEFDVAIMCRGSIYIVLLNFHVIFDTCCVCVQMTVRMEKFGCRMGQPHPMAEWRCARMGYGAQSVPASGMILMPVWCAGSWAMTLRVNEHLQ